MQTSVLEAIKQGDWEFEPTKVDAKEYDSTSALPGTDAKLDIMAQRVKSGLPLWHPSDRSCYAEDAD